MHALIAVQVAFCFVVLFVAGLFAATFDRITHRAMGFSADRILTLDAVTPRSQPAVFWEQAADHLRAMPGVESVALASWALLFNNSWNGFVSVNGASGSHPGLLGLARLGSAAEDHPSRRTRPGRPMRRR